jgi:hypothetical protein
LTTEEIQSIVREEVARRLSDLGIDSGELLSHPGVDGPRWLPTRKAVAALQGVVTMNQMHRRARERIWTENVHFRNIGGSGATKPTYEWNVSAIRADNVPFKPQRSRKRI